ncbi:endonuclease-reverse transcriptase, partial [Clonorchis sinensis]
CRMGNPDEFRTRQLQMGHAMLCGFNVLVTFGNEHPDPADFPTPDPSSTQDELQITGEELGRVVRNKYTRMNKLTLKLFCRLSISIFGIRRISIRSVSCPSHSVWLMNGLPKYRNWDASSGTFERIASTLPTERKADEIKLAPDGLIIRPENENNHFECCRFDHFEQNTTDIRNALLIRLLKILRQPTTGFALPVRAHQNMRRLVQHIQLRGNITNGILSWVPARKQLNSFVNRFRKKILYFCDSELGIRKARYSASHTANQPFVAKRLSCELVADVPGVSLVPLTELILKWKSYHSSGLALDLLKMSHQQLHETRLTILFCFNVLATFDNVHYTSSGASAPVPTSTQERLVGLACEECGKCCKSKAGLVAHHRVHDNESVAFPYTWKTVSRYRRRLVHRVPANWKEIHRANYVTIQTLYHQKRTDAASALLDGSWKDLYRGNYDLPVDSERYWEQVTSAPKHVDSRPIRAVLPCDCSLIEPIAGEGVSCKIRLMGTSSPTVDMLTLRMLRRFNANALAWYFNLLLLPGVFRRTCVVPFPEVHNPISPDKLRPIFASSILVRCSHKRTWSTLLIVYFCGKFRLGYNVAVWTLEGFKIPCAQTVADEYLVDLEYADDIVLVFEGEDKDQHKQVIRLSLPLTSWSFSNGSCYYIVYALVFGDYTRLISSMMGKTSDQLSKNFQQPYDQNDLQMSVFVVISPALNSFLLKHVARAVDFLLDFRRTGQDAAMLLVCNNGLDCDRNSFLDTALFVRKPKQKHLSLIVAFDTPERQN